MTIRQPLDPFSEVVNEPRRWTPEWYSWLTEIAAQVNANGTAVAASIASSTGGSGILTYVNDSQLKFAPYNGNGIKINGVIYQIPSAGIAGLGRTGVFVNGVAGQNLSLSNVTYRIYVFNNGGTLTADYCTVAHTTSTTAGNVGTEIKSGDDTRTFIGLATVGSTGFLDTAQLRWVRTWFNRQPAFCGPMSVNFSTTAPYPYTIGGNAIYFLPFEGEVISMYVNGYMSAAPGSVTAGHVIAVDGVISGSGVAAWYSVYGATNNVAMRHTQAFSEGSYHLAQAAIYSDGTNTMNIVGFIYAEFN